MVRIRLAGFADWAVPLLFTYRELTGSDGNYSDPDPYSGPYFANFPSYSMNGNPHLMLLQHQSIPSY